ncbi:MAG: hypothetical protein AB2462_02195 [Thermoanaerobacter sp.]|nr:hypothetical protein [Thermoanaerobacter thermohydrosulfuricus]
MKFDDYITKESYSVNINYIRVLPIAMTTGQMTETVASRAA